MQPEQLVDRIGVLENSYRVSKKSEAELLIMEGEAGEGRPPLLIEENHLTSWKLPCWGGLHAQNLDAELLGLRRDRAQWGSFKKCGEGPEGAGGREG